MSLLLHINTALEKAWVGLSDDNHVIAYRSNDLQKEHGSFLQPAIRELSKESGIALNALDAVSVVNGPGSYTGLRVGLAAAKGICFALHKPLVSLSTLEWIAFPFRNQEAWICPMIDARRMEVFMALYDASLQTVLEPQAMILDNYSFPMLHERPAIFVGNGRNKLPAAIRDHENARFPAGEAALEEQSHMAHLAYSRGQFADLAYTEPMYLKPFHTTGQKKK